MSDPDLPAPDPASAIVASVLENRTYPIEDDAAEVLVESTREGIVRVLEIAEYRAKKSEIKRINAVHIVQSYREYTSEKSFIRKARLYASEFALLLSGTCFGLSIEAILNTPPDVSLTKYILIGILAGASAVTGIWLAENG